MSFLLDGAIDLPLVESSCRENKMCTRSSYLVSQVWSSCYSTDWSILFCCNSFKCTAFAPTGQQAEFRSGISREQIRCQILQSCRITDWTQSSTALLWGYLQVLRFWNISAASEHVKENEINPIIVSLIVQLCKWTCHIVPETWRVIKSNQQKELKKVKERANRERERERERENKI